jgi:uncharacterized membrane protein YphA (DoxX/SURF4 family)
MNNPATTLTLLFLTVTFIQSAYDKLFDWNNNVSFLQEHFANTFLKNNITIALGLILILELVSGILTLSGCVELFINNTTKIGFYGAVLSCITLILLLLGQRMAKDYDGARTIAIYFIPAVMAVFWLS